MSASEDIVRRLRSANPDVQVGAIVDMMQAGDAAGLPELVALTASPDVAIRATAARALGELGDADPAGRALLSLVEDLDPLVRAEAIDALGVLRYAPAAQAVARALHDVQPLVRASAAETAGDLGDATVIPELERALSDDDEAVRGYAASSLGRLGAPELDQRLREHLRTERSPRVQAELLVSRQRLGGLDDLGALATLLEDIDDGDADAVLGAVAELGPPPLQLAPSDAARLRDALERLADRLPRLRGQVAEIVAFLDA
jgi:HEAT repeat protein